MIPLKTKQWLFHSVRIESKVLTVVYEGLRDLTPPPPHVNPIISDLVFYSPFALTSRRLASLPLLHYSSIPSHSAWKLLPMIPLS